MSELATELRAIGRAINHEEYVDAGVVPLTLVHAADRIEALEAALREAERFMAYFCNETDGQFDGPGTPSSCLAEIRAALALAPETEE